MDFPNPDYVALARACGAVGFKAQKPGELREAIVASRDCSIRMSNKRNGGGNDRMGGFAWVPPLR
jgi:hypothetical protein